MRTVRDGLKNGWIPASKNKPKHFAGMPVPAALSASTAEASAPSRLHSDSPLVYDELNRVLGLEGLIGDFSTDAHGIVIRTVHPPRVPGGGVETPPAEPSDLADDDPCS